MSMRTVVWATCCFSFAASIASADESAVTSLSNRSVKYTLPGKPYIVLQRGEVTAVVVDNSAVSDQVLPDHRAGYSGIASLTHARQRENLFVPHYAGLNFEHIHDGTTQDRDILFEPRRAEMELRRVSRHVVELYQPPTPTWGLESVLRYEMLADGTLEMTLECIPRLKTFRNGYVGLFWASYIHQPASLDVHFRGHGKPDVPAGWIRGITPAHGKLSTHVGSGDERRFPHDADFPLSLVFNRSDYRFAEPWYYGVSHGMAFVQMFRPRDQVRLSQSPSGGGRGNSAWDFQYFIPEYEVDRLYRMVMRAMYVPYESPRQIERVSASNRKALGTN